VVAEHLARTAEADISPTYLGVTRQWWIWFGIRHQRPTPLRRITVRCHEVAVGSASDLVDALNGDGDGRVFIK
jgi:hypothetical protein